MPGATQPKGADYSVKSAETVMAGSDVRVRLFTLGPGEVIPWHSHSEIADEFFVLDGELTVETSGPDDYRILALATAIGSMHRTLTRLQTPGQRTADF
jgi:quercetin dioxygenase-like cupin family protein